MSRRLLATAAATAMVAENKWATAAREEARAELDIHGQAIIATKGHRGVRERPETGA